MSGSNPFRDIVLLIPAYNPDERLTELVSRLIARNFEKIVVVNDGSDAIHRAVFDVLDELEAVSICEHAINRGKGAALKTGIQFVASSTAAPKGVITADADGQHLPEDICKIAAAALERPNEILLGSRAFDDDTPLRSRVGNRVTAWLMNFVHGISLADTQTGLRYLPRALFPDLLTLSGNRYDYEMQCLIHARERGVQLVPIPINTVYIEENASSHFLPIVDSVRVYSVLFRFGGSSIVCFLLDIALFAWIFSHGQDAMLATVLARTASGVVNFLFNKFVVFRRRMTGAALREALGYFALWLLLMLVSGSMVSLAAAQPTVWVVAVKILVDISLFLLSYYAQSRYIFARKP